MAEWTVGVIMQKLIEKLTDTCSDYLIGRWQTDMKEELIRLQDNHITIQAIVSAASQVQKIDSDCRLNKWIWQLRDAIDEADDVLDDFEYKKHEEQLARNLEETKKRSIWSSLSEPAKKFLKAGAQKFDPKLVSLEKVVQKLGRVSDEARTFLYLLKDTKKEQQVQQNKLKKYRETGSIPKDVLIGRLQEKDFVEQWLKKLPNEEHRSHVTANRMYKNISLLSIVGHGGIGKTTLLQHVYTDTTEFELKMWVCVSYNFDVKNILTDMFEFLTNTRPTWNALGTLQNNLELVLKSKKFLLVLDDIWEEDVGDYSKWQDLLAPFNDGGLGSKIVITTRMNSVASMIANVMRIKNELLILKGLEEEECLQLLNTHALANIAHPNGDNKLRSITTELVRKLSGSPLAAKVISDELKSSSNERQCKNILNRGLDHKDIILILKLSYTFLPDYLQNCFAFCGIFAQDHVFDKDELVRMWIAVGFIQPSNIQGETLEDIGGSYFDNFVNKSFFDKIEAGYKMHYLLYKLAKSVSAQECLRIVGDEDLDFRIPETIRHLFVETNNLELLKQKGKFKNLRTLCITYVQDNQGFVDVLTKIFEETSSIRLLSISACNRRMIPETIGRLKHLRYLKLKLACPANASLPRSLSKLYHLQVLICNSNVSQDMNNLSNQLRELQNQLPSLKIQNISEYQQM